MGNPDIAVLLLLIGLPLAVWLDLRNLAERSLDLQANNLNSVITSVRSYYARNVVARVLASPGATQVVHNYSSVPGAIPIPATLSLELGKVIGEEQGGIAYRFVSDYPFKGRAPHEGLARGTRAYFGRIACAPRNWDHANSVWRSSCALPGSR